MKGAGPLAWMLYLLIRAVFALMQCCPLEWNLGTARILARVWPWVMPRHRQRAIAHLAAAYHGQKSVRELARIADESLAATAMFAVEAVCLPRLITPTTWPHFVRLRGFEGALRILLSGKGAILVTGHYGSFELLGHLLAAMGFPVAAVMRPLDNVYLNRFIVESRRVHGLELLDKKGATEGAHDLVRSGTMVGFIGDQDAGRKGIFVDFFGQTASTYKSIGLLAMAAEVPIIVGYARRLGHRSEYEVGVPRIILPAEWQAQPDPLKWITQQYTSAIEDFVRAAPEQYLWTHRRWKTRDRRRKESAETPATCTPAQPQAVSSS